MPEEYKIIVNGTEHVVRSDIVTFEEVIDLAFPGHPSGDNIVYSVTFEKARSEPHHGTLAPGGKVTVKEHGTIFDATRTDRS